MPRSLRHDLPARRTRCRAYRTGAETGRTTLASASDSPQLAVVADRNQVRADDTDLAYISIGLCDREGNLANHGDRLINVQVSGPAVLAGLGSGRTSTEERFDATSCRTFDGHALAILRPTAPGDVHVHIGPSGCPATIVDLQATTRDRVLAAAGPRRVRHASTRES